MRQRRGASIHVVEPPQPEGVAFMNKASLSWSLGFIVVLFMSSCGSPLPSFTALEASPSPVSALMATNPVLPTATAPVELQSGIPFLCQSGSPAVYLVFNAQRHQIVDWETFLNLGFKQEQIIACGANAAYSEGGPLTSLLKGSGDAVYWLENGLRRHIPDMETFRALGYREQDIALVPDELLAIWPLGEPVPSLQVSPSPRSTATPMIVSAPTAESATTLRDALKNIHDQFEIDPTRGCFELLTPYPEYHEGLQRMTALLLTDPRAQALSFAEREALFEEVAGFDGVRFIAGNGAATLVSLRTNRGYNVGCGSHYQSPDALHVVDQAGAVYDIGTGGLLAQTWWATGRWIVLLRLKLDASSGPTRWAIWQIGQTGGAWQRLVEFEFVPPPYNFDAPPLYFENGDQTMIADLDYWWATDPCEFSAAFTDTYRHDTWQIRQRYQMVGNTYELSASEVLTFPVYRKDTGEAVVLDWC
jgi:hypothetical protein